MKGGINNMVVAGSKAEIDKLAKLLRKTDIQFKIRNQDGTTSKVKLERTGWNLKRKTYIKTSQSLLDEDYQLVFNLERR